MCFSCGRHGHIARDCEARRKPTIQKEQRSAVENPVARRKEAAWIPLATTRENKELCIRAEVQGTSYEFIIDTGADVCLVQPYVGDEPTKEIRDAVRGINGQELEIEGTGQLGVLIGDKCYTYDFVVALFSIKKDGIIGLDLLRALGARIDIASGETDLDGQEIKLTNLPPCGRKVNRRQSTVRRTGPRLLESTEEKVEGTTETTTEARRPVIEAVKEASAKPSRTESPVEDGQVEGFHKWQAVLPQTVHLEHRTLLITGAKITNLQRRATPKSSTEGLIHAEPVEIPLRGIYAARTVSNTFAISALVEHEQRKTRVQPKEFADSNIKRQNMNETVYCTAQLVNTSIERITLQAGMRIADVYNVTGADLIDGVTETDVNNDLRVLRADQYPRQLGPKVREQSARAPKVARRKLSQVRREQHTRHDK
jgi:predicted aspartyl protease